MVPPPRNVFSNFERMRREMDQVFGDIWDRAGYSSRRALGFSPQVDVYYADDPPRAVVKADLAGVDIDAVGLEITGRQLVITGERPMQETEGRVYQQVEIEAGPFRRVIELGADVIAEQASAAYRDGMLRVELPLHMGEAERRQVPISPDPESG